MPSRLVIAFLPKSKHLLISWFQSPSAVILEPKKFPSDSVKKKNTLQITLLKRHYRMKAFTVPQKERGTMAWGLRPGDLEADFLGSNETMNS